jgi:hypothetical protein
VGDSLLQQGGNVHIVSSIDQPGRRRGRADRRIWSSRHRLLDDVDGERSR